MIVIIHLLISSRFNHGSISTDRSLNRSGFEKKKKHLKASFNFNCFKTQSGLFFLVLRASEWWGHFYSSFGHSCGRSLFQLCFPFVQQNTANYNALFFFFSLFSSFHQKTIFLICLRGNCEHELKCCENKEK
jgi:hypothetical protein